MIKSILLVCIGNICRSPMAEGLLKHFIITNELSVNIASAGINACVGQAAHPIAQQLLLEKGINISDHRARQLNEEYVRSSELILVMDEDQLNLIKMNFPFAQGRVHTLGKWSQFEVPDPINCSIDYFRSVFKLISQGVDDWELKLLQ